MPVGRAPRHLGELDARYRRCSPGARPRPADRRWPAGRPCSGGRPAGAGPRPAHAGRHRTDDAAPSRARPHASPLGVCLGATVGAPSGTGLPISVVLRLSLILIYHHERARRRSGSDRRKPDAAGHRHLPPARSLGCRADRSGVHVRRLGASSSTPGVINAVGAESQYANVLSQIGGTLRPRVVGPRQPQHRPAYLRGQHQRGRGGGTGRPGRPERDRLRRLHGQDRVRLPEPAPVRSSWPSTCSVSRTAPRTRISGTTRRPCPRWPR